MTAEEEQRAMEGLGALTQEAMTLYTRLKEYSQTMEVGADPELFAHVHNALFHMDAVIQELNKAD